MAFPEDRLSTTPEPDEYLSPDGLGRSLNQDFELGPTAIGDTSRGIAFQLWSGGYNPGTGDITLTPADIGEAVVVLNVANLTELSFCFDNNGNIAIVYAAAAVVSLYWYDTVAGSYATMSPIADALSAMVTLDDKRLSQTQLNDILLIYTKAVDETFGLFQRKQRDRYDADDEIDLQAECFRYMWKCGMHRGNRVQITTISAAN